MNTNSFFKSPWLIGGAAAIVIFALCFWAINQVSKQPADEGPKVEKAVIATMQTNPELMAIARQQGWIGPDALEMTTIDAKKVTDIGTVFQGSALKHFEEFRHFVGITEIKADAFRGCEALTTLVIPQRVASIAYGALAGCKALTQLSVDTANTHYDSRNDCNAIICTWKGKLMVVAGSAATVVPADVRYIAPQAFSGCTALAALALPERMEEIGEQAFSGCTALQTIDIPQGVKRIEPSAFAGCTALHTVSLPKSLNELADSAFAGCTALQTIRCPKRYPPHLRRAFDAYGATVVVPAGKAAAYRRAPGWKNFRNIREE